MFLLQKLYWCRFKHEESESKDLRISFFPLDLEFLFFFLILSLNFIFFIGFSNFTFSIGSWNIVFSTGSWILNFHSIFFHLKRERQAKWIIKIMIVSSELATDWLIWSCSTTTFLTMWNNLTLRRSLKQLFLHLRLLLNSEILGKEYAFMMQKTYIF